MQKLLRTIVVMAMANTNAAKIAFASVYRPKRKVLIGSQGIPLEEFLQKPATHWAA